MYLHSRSWGVQPSEFWAMTLGEWYAEYELHTNVNEKKYAGKLTKSDVDDLKEWMEKKNVNTGHES